MLLSLFLLLLPPTTTQFAVQLAALPRATTRATTLDALSPSLASRLTSITRSFDSLTERLGDPDVLSSPALLRTLTEERAKTEDLVSKFVEYTKLQQDKDYSEAVMQEKGCDPEMREMAMVQTYC